MNRLADRNRQIPNGYKFYQPETKWSPPAWSSFDSIVQLLVRHRAANPYLREKHNWAVDYESVANEVEAFNVKLCEQHGWTGFLMSEEGKEPPKSLTLQFSAQLRAVAAGAETLVDWIKNKGEAVPLTQAVSRASVCAVCPRNERGDWTSFFTQPVSMAIRQLISKRNDWRLTTPYDSRLFVCSACLCPLPLLVHVPPETKWKHMSPEAKAALWDQCWLPKEINDPKRVPRV